MENTIQAQKSIPKKFLYMTAFFSGMSVMAVELGASRLLAPYFSSSQIVWTVIIGTIMIAMALGNIIGGRMADKNPDPRRLYGRLMIAAVWIAAIPVFGKYIITGISVLLALVVQSNFLVWASFASCIVLFVFPLLLLGTVTPSLVKYAVTSLDDSGKTVGIISAMGTIGSIIGTFVPTFITIPTVGTSITFLLFALVLAIICIIFFILQRSLRVRNVICILLIIAMFFIPGKNNFAFWQRDMIYEGESVYNYLQVRENDQAVWLSTNVMEGVQSIKMKDRQLTGMYYDYALAAPIMAGLKPYENNQDKNILILGLGTGTYAGLCQEFFGEPQIEGVEIDRKIIDLASTYFDLADTVQTVEYDGRAFLQTGIAKDQSYDVIMVDAYQDITIPFQMSSIEFFSLVQEHLKPEGVMVVNMNMYSNKEGSLNNYLTDTIASIFSNVSAVSTQNNTNRVLFAANTEQAFELLNTEVSQNANDTALNKMMGQVNQNLEPIEKGDYILTDDQAPVELLGMQVIDGIISNTLDYYRGELTGKSWEEIWSMIQAG